MDPAAAPAPVVLDHDGAVDDFLALLLLACASAVRLEAVVVTPADCYGPPALDATRKILRFAGHEGVPAGLSGARPVNPFPREWRLDSYVVSNLPILAGHGGGGGGAGGDGGDLLADAVAGADEPVTVVVTGPLSTLAAALDRRDGLAGRDALAGRIRQVVWMGGALEVAGNVDPGVEHSHDGTAEWNAYWDPAAVADVLASGVPLVLCPLDATNAMPVDAGLMAWLAADRAHPACDLAGQCYALVAHREYYAWDLLTAGYALWPELFATERRPVRVVTSGPGQGRTRPDPAGTPVEVVTGVDREAFLARLRATWTGSGP